MTRFADVLVVFRKEVLETVRDYKNLLVMAFIPVVFLQVMIAATQTMVEHSIGQIKKQRITIAVYGDSQDQFLRRMLAAADSSVAFAEPLGENPDAAISQGDFDLAVVAPAKFLENIKAYGEPQSIELVYDARQPNAIFAFARVHGILNALKQSLKADRIASAHLSLPRELPITYVTQGRQVSRGLRNISIILPSLLLLVVLIALLSPSIDLFTGENERGTMPLLLVSPVETRDIFLGKLAVVCLFGQSAVTLGLLSFFVTVNFFGHRGDAFLSFTGINAESMVLIFFLMLPLVVLLSALSSLLASKCKTFQQGQGYYLPFMIAAICPAFVLDINDASIASFLAFIPVGNICLAMKQVLTHDYQWGWLLLTFLVSSVYAAFAVERTVATFDRKAQMNQEHVTRFVRWKSQDFRPEVGLLLAAAFFLMFYAGQMFPSWDPLLGTVISQVAGVFLPAIIAVKWLKLPLKSTLSLTWPSWKMLSGALLISPATAALSVGISQLQSLVLPVPESFAKAFLEMVMPAGRPLWLAILVFALLPAVCEELLFRGAVLGLLKKKLDAKTVVVLVGVLFGAFHLSSYRFLGTASLGIVLSAVVYFGGSIFPAMLLHGCHNALLISAQVNHLEHFSTLQLLVASALSLVGAALLWSDVQGRRKSVHPNK